MKVDLRRAVVRDIAVNPHRRQWQGRIVIVRHAVTCCVSTLHELPLFLRAERGDAVAVGGLIDHPCKGSCILAAR